jgi:mRNA-degrading endonuclease toxin of MazEF toxin-antitoxin module
VLVVKGLSSNVCLIVPLTTSTKINPYHVNIGVISGRDNFVIISQIRLIDTKRLHDRIAILDQNKFDEIRKAIRNLI